MWDPGSHLHYAFIALAMVSSVICAFSKSRSRNPFTVYTANLAFNLMYEVTTIKTLGYIVIGVDQDIYSRHKLPHWLPLLMTVLIMSLYQLSPSNHSTYGMSSVAWTSMIIYSNPKLKLVVGLDIVCNNFVPQQYVIFATPILCLLSMALCLTDAPRNLAPAGAQRS